MQFLSNNGFRAAVVIFILFLAVPFLFVDKTAITPKASAEGEALPVGVSKNPLSKFFNRVGSFYGFKKKGNGLDKLNSFANAGDAAKNLGYNSDGSPITFDEASPEAKKGFIPMQDNNMAGGSAAGSSAQQNVQEYVRMDGKTYEVVKDPSGKKYVLTDSGPVSFDELMSSTVSKEEFEAAKKIAPNLSDEELVYAIRSPYGVKGYLDRKTKGLLTYDDNPTLFGGPEGNLQGQRGSALFGGASGHSMFGNEEAFDEAKSGLASKYAKIKRDSAAAAAPRSIASSYSAGGQVNGKYKEPVVAELASMIVGKPVIGNAELASINPPEIKAVFGSTKKPSASSDFLLKKVEGDNTQEVGLIIESKTSRDLMVSELLGSGKSFKGKYVNGQEKGKEEINPFIFPTDDKVYSFPGQRFKETNTDILKDSTLVNVSDWEASDSEYDKIKNQISSQKPKIGKISYLMIDGKDENGNIKLVSKNSYHYKVFKGLIGNADDVVQNDNINPAKINKKTIFVVPDKATAQKFKDAGLYVVDFDEYAVTPERLTKVYNGTLKVVQNMAANKNKKLDKKQQELTRQAIAELSGVRKK